MTLFKRIIILSLCVVGYAFPSDQKFQHKIPTGLEAILNTQWSSCTFGRVGECSGLPGWYIKRNAKARLEGADAIHKALAELKKTGLFVLPQKYLYNATDKQQYVIAQAIEKIESTFSVDDVKEIMRIAKKSGWYDCHPSNFFRTPDKKIALIDTEHIVDRDKLVNAYQLKFYIVNQFLKTTKTDLYTPHALRYLKNKHTKYIEWPHPERVLMYLNKKEIKKRCEHISSFLHQVMGNIG